jgi:AraC-like DNA-binding protein
MSSGAVQGVRVFTTAGVPAEERIALWQEHNSAALMRLRCRTFADVQFDGTTVNVQLSRTRLSRLKAETPHVIERQSDLIRSQPEDAVVLFFVLAGEAFFYHSNGVHILRRGQLIACDCDRPFMRGFSSDFEELFLKIPRQVFYDAVGFEQIQAPLVAGFTDHQKLLSASLAGVIATTTRTDTQHMPDEAAMLDLVSALMGGRERTDRSAYLVAARRYVDSRLSDPSLSATTIAAAVGISTRHLSRTFASAGTTVPQYVLERRLAAARALLQRQDAAAMSIGEVARRCGFTSVSHFSRSFAEQFGQRASDVRRHALWARIEAPSLGSSTADDCADSANGARFGRNKPVC